MPIESIYLEAFFDSVLNNDATLIGATALGGKKFYKNRAPQNTTYPLGIYNVQAADDIALLNRDRLFTRYLLQVRIVGRVVGAVFQDGARVRTASHRADAVLQSIRRQSFTVDSVTYFFNVFREGELPVREEEGESADVFYRSYGGFYRGEVFT